MLFLHYNNTKGNLNVIMIETKPNLVSVSVPVIKERKRRPKAPKPGKAKELQTVEDKEKVKKEILDLKTVNKQLNTFRKTKIEAAELQIIRRLPNIVKRTIEMAESGDIQAIKILLDRVIRVQKAMEPQVEKLGSKGFSVNITVNGKNTDNSVLIEQPTIEDGTFEEINEDE